MNKLSKIRTGLMWIVAIALTMSYFSILYKGLKPDVCWEYQLYYVDEKIDNWPKYGGLSYTLGDVDDFMLKATDESMSVIRKGSGWSIGETGGTWTVGKEALLYYSKISPSVDKMQLNIDIAQYAGNISLDVYANDTYIGSTSETEVAQNVRSFKFDSSCLVEGRLEVKLVINNFMSPLDAGTGDDPRQLGILVKNITITGEQND